MATANYLIVEEKGGTVTGLQDRSRQIITTCQLGPNAARGAKLLQDMGFTNVAYMEGGMAAWEAAGLPAE